MNKSKRGRLIALLSVLIGILFLGIAVFLSARSSEFRTRGIEAQAVITRIERTSDSTEVYVSYTADGKNYSGRLDTYVAGMETGDSVPILYLPENPSKITYARFTRLPSVVFGVVGALILGLGLFGALWGPLKNLRLERMKKRGKEISAVISDFKRSENVRIFGKAPASLICADSFGNIYKAGIFAGRGEHFVPGEKISVYIDPSRPGKYAVDVPGFLQKKMCPTATTQSE